MKTLIIAVIDEVLFAVYFLGAVQVLLETVNKMAIVIDDKANDNQNQDNEYFLQGIGNTDIKSETLRTRAQWKNLSWWLT